MGRDKFRFIFVNPAVRSTVEPSIPLTVGPNSLPPTFFHSLFSFLEQPLYTAPAGVLGGIVGLLYTPALAICGLSFIAAFHRSGWVRGKPWKVQLPAYLCVFAASVGVLFGVYALLKRSVHIPTAAEIGAYVVEHLPKSPTAALITSTPTPTAIATPPEDDPISLRQRSNVLAKELVEYADQREGSFADLQQKIMAAKLVDSLLHGSESQDLDKKIAQWNDQTNNQIVNLWWPQVISLQNDLENARIDTSSVTRAVATGGPRAVGFRLGVIADNISKHGPFERDLTKLEADAIAKNSLNKVEIYVYEHDQNSARVASVMQVAYRAAGSRTTMHSLKIRKPMPSGIHVIFPAGDVRSQNITIRLLKEAEIASQSEVAPAEQQQDYSTLKIEVWPCDSSCLDLFIAQHRGLN